MDKGENEVTPEEKGYIAGFLDGEGEVSVNNSTCYVKFNNTDRRPLVWMRDKIGTGRIMPTRKNPRGSNHNRCFMLMVVGRDAQSLLRNIFPLLIIKKRQAELVLMYPFSVGYRLGSADIIKRRKIVGELRVLNKRGFSIWKDVEFSRENKQLSFLI